MILKNLKLKMSESNPRSKLLLYVIFKCLGIENTFVFISYEMLEVNKFRILGLKFDFLIGNFTS